MGSRKSYYKVSIILLIIMIFSLLISCDKSSTGSDDDGVNLQRSVEWPSLADSPWPMALNSPQLTGNTKVNTSPTGELIWEIDLNDGIYSGIVIDECDNIIFGSHQHYHYLTKLNTMGEIIWTFETGKENPSPGLIDKNGVIYFCSNDGYIYALKSEGNLKWKYYSDLGFRTSVINIDKNGNLYCIGYNRTSSEGCLISLSSSGEFRWKIDGKNLNWWSGISFSIKGDQCYVISEEGLLSVDTSGNILWNVYSNCKVYDVPAIDNDDNLYITISDDSCSYLVSLNSSGVENWRFKYLSSNPVGTILVTPVSISEKGKIFFAGYTEDNNDEYYTGSALYCFSRDGNLEWKSLIPYDVFTAPLLISNNGYIYLASTLNEGCLYIFDNNGNLFKKVSSIKGAVDGSMAMLSDGTLIVGTHGPVGYNKIYAIK